MTTMAIDVVDAGRGREGWELVSRCLDLLAPPEWPADELRPRDEVRRRLEDPAAYGCEQVVFAALDARRTVGMAVLHHLPRTLTAFLEYLCVAEDGRGRGVGARLFAACREEAAARRAARLLVEYDDAATVDREGLERWHWYAQRGVYRTSWTYWQPPYRSSDPPKAMTLAFDLALARHPGSVAAVAEAVGEAYCKVYSLAPDDPLLVEVTGAMAEHPAVLVDAADKIVAHFSITPTEEAP